MIKDFKELFFLRGKMMLLYLTEVINLSGRVFKFLLSKAFLRNFSF